MTKRFYAERKAGRYNKVHIMHHVIPFLEENGYTIKRIIWDNCKDTIIAEEPEEHVNVIEQTIPDEIKEEIWFLYFEKLYSYEQLITHFENRFTYKQIQNIIYEKFGSEDD